MGSKMTLYKEDYLPHQWEFLTINKVDPKKKINAMSVDWVVEKLGCSLGNVHIT